MIFIILKFSNFTCLSNVHIVIQACVAKMSAKFASLKFSIFKIVKFLLSVSALALFQTRQCDVPHMGDPHENWLGDSQEN